MKYPDVQLIIDKLRTIDPDDFNMDREGDINGMFSIPCCIGGWCRTIETSRSKTIEMALMNVCGFNNYPLAKLITYPPNDIPDWEDITLPMAIEVLEIFRDTGEVRWIEVYEKHTETSLN